MDSWEGGGGGVLWSNVRVGVAQLTPHFQHTVSGGVVTLKNPILTRHNSGCWCRMFSLRSHRRETKIRHQSDSASVRADFAVYNLVKSQKVTSVVLFELLTCPAFSSLVLEMLGSAVMFLG